MEKLVEELKETEAVAQDFTGTNAAESETDPAATGDPGATKETDKSKLFLVVILLVALGGCGFWLVKKLRKNKMPKRNINAPNDEDLEEQLDIPVDMDEEERG